MISFFCRIHRSNGPPAEQEISHILRSQLPKFLPYERMLYGLLSKGDAMAQILISFNNCPATSGHSGTRIISPGDIDHLGDRKSTRLNSSHVSISYAVFCLKRENGLIW